MFGIPGLFGASRCRQAPIIAHCYQALNDHFTNLIPTIVPSETPVATHSIPVVVSPVMWPKKLVKTESKSWLPISKLSEVQHMMLARISAALVYHLIQRKPTIGKTA